MRIQCHPHFLVVCHVHRVILVGCGVLRVIHAVCEVVLVLGFFGDLQFGQLPGRQGADMPGP